MDGIDRVVTMIACSELSQAQLAREAECSQSHLSLILKRKRGMSVALAGRLSNATGVPIRELLPDLAEALDAAE